MLKLLLVSHSKDSLRGLSSSLSGKDDIELEMSTSGEEALTRLSSKTVDLVVADEDLGDMTALELSKRLLRINPMINCAVVSSLSPEEFHEASEGLGIMTQLPRQPGMKEAEILIRTLKQIQGLLD
ncbi:Response regulator receiver domain-containing protein [Syntrophus gentianae]|uniref:Response regulator receiver domain-containing protein n=1 Tax=Syntrophus gentianae TaxID=43775 RepID=A0A1H7V614_9BACT|nr:response regulator [Syntrophus gentianae]SEM04499.1 Response regulator receiver domain-containing protein [Syntrophus gentianae]